MFRCKIKSTNAALYDYFNNLSSSVFETAILRSPLTFSIIFAIGAIPASCVWNFLPMMLKQHQEDFDISDYAMAMAMSFGYIAIINGSTILVYYFGNRHRPKLVAVGLLLIAVATACFASERELLQHLLSSKNESMEHNYILSNGQNECPKNSKHLCHSNNQLGDALYFSGTPLFAIGIFCSMACWSFFFSNGFSYMDDNSSKENTLIFLALHTIGVTIGEAFIRIYTNEFIVTKLYLSNNRKATRWTQQWWVGFVIIGVFSTLISIALSMFPKQMRYRYRSEPCEMEEAKISCLPDRNVSTDKFKEFPSRLKWLMKNKLFVTNALASSFTVFCDVMMTFLTAEALERVYGEGWPDASYIAINLRTASMSIGAIAVGIWAKKFKPQPHKLLNCCSIALLTCAVLSICFAGLNCNIPEIKPSLVKENGCQSECNCSYAQFDPLCDKDSGITYYSECHAKCSTSIISNLESNVWKCGCLKSDGNISYSVSTFGKCTHKNYCETNKNLYIGIVFLLTLSITSSQNIFTFVSVRCVEKRDKTFSLAVKLAFESIFAFAPLPFIMKLFKTASCTLWEANHCKRKVDCINVNTQYYLYMYMAAFLISFTLAITFNIYSTRLSKKLNKVFYFND